MRTLNNFLYLDHLRGEPSRAIEGAGTSNCLMFAGQLKAASAKLVVQGDLRQHTHRHVDPEEAKYANGALVELPYPTTDGVPVNLELGMRRDTMSQSYTTKLDQL